MTYQELMDFVADIPSNYNEDTFIQFYKHVPNIEKGVFLDFGTGLGKSVIAIAKLRPDLEIYTVDNGVPYNFDDYNDYIQKHLDSHKITNVNHFKISSLDYNLEKPLVGLNIDSGHDYELTIAEMNKWIPKVVVGGYVFLDDYLVERCGVKQAVDEYMKNNGVGFEDLNPGGMCQVYRRMF